MRTLIVIPARYASSRLPGKPLLRSTGKYLIQHVYERVCQANCAKQVVIATDDPRIAAAADSFGGEWIMTGRQPSGTDRVAEVARRIDADLYVNVQGDEPLIEPASLDRLVGLFDRSPDSAMATLAAPITSQADFDDPGCVKVVCDDSGRALYFSRSPIPCVRDGSADFQAKPPRFLQHIGIYAYRKSTLLQLAGLPACSLEQLEKLEQLRALAHGWTIQVGTVARASRGVDTFEDYQRFVRDYSANRDRLARAA